MYKKQLETGTILFVEVPIDAQNIMVDGAQSSTARLTFYDSGWDWIKLPPGNFHLLSDDSTKITEEQLKEVMPRASSGFYYAYNSPYLGAIWNTANEAFHSLKRSLGVVDMNKYPDHNIKHPMCRDCADEDGTCPNYNGRFCEPSLREEQYQQEQSKVRRYAVLFDKK